ncbi:MAG: hypothetical protein GY856_23640 [bacterium]|nr:hypothetical protein [bacterium]
MINHQDIMSCREAEAILDELVEGRLPAALERRLREHLAGCEACRHEEAALRRLLDAAAELPRALEPPADLWPQIAPRLRQRRFAAFTLARRRGTWRGWLLQAVAAVVFMGLGAVLSQLLVAPASEPGSPGGGEPAAVRTVAAAQTEFEMIEAEFLRAKEDLWLTAYRGSRGLAPVTQKVVERNLRIIDEAIRELRGALEANPGDRQLEGLLLANHRKEINLLQRLARGSEV